MIIGVIAGTPVDTAMGVEFVNSKGVSVIGRYCSADPVEQTRMQVLYKEELAELFITIANEMVDEGVTGIYVYCNSLSGAIDLTYVRSKIAVPVVTPLDVYAQCATEYSCIAIMAANGQSLSSIERTILSKNSDCSVYGVGILPLANMIETSEIPEKIYNKLKINELTKHLETMNGEVLILGCTHFPYIENEIAKGTTMPIINPAQKMLDMLIG